MSIKKAIGIPLLLLASIIILAHAVVPHHHHDGVVVAVSELFSLGHDHDHDHDSSIAHHHHSHAPEEHNHDGEFNENCLLGDLYLRISQDRQQHFSSDNSDLFKYLDYSPLFAVVPSVEIEIKDYGNQPFWQKPYISSSYNHFITHSLGLRAPPVC